MRTKALLACVLAAATANAETPTKSEPVEEVSDARTAIKVTMLGSFAISAISGGLWLYSRHQTEAFAEADIPSGTTFDNNMAQSVGEDDCGKGVFRNADGSLNQGLNSKFSTACTAHDRTKWLFPTFVASTALAVGTAIYLGVTNPKREKTVAVVPTATDHSAGVTAVLRW